LDEKAIEAVRQWRFTPGMKDGNAVAVAATVQVNFRLIKTGPPNLWYSGPLVFALESGVTGPVVEEGTMPKAVREVLDESAVLDFTVGSSGSVKSIRSTHGSESSSELLSSYLEKWKFRPAMKDGQAVEATGSVRFIKGLGDETSKPPLSTPPPGHTLPAGPIVGMVYTPGNGVTAPVVISKVPPEYTQEAQNARRSGTVVLSVVVDAEGYARDIKVLEQLGMGLDQKAIEAVQRWRFRPGYKDGQAVNVLMQVEVGFSVQ
jgi:TonB family protein